MRMALVLIACLTAGPAVAGTGTGTGTGAGAGEKPFENAVFTVNGRAITRSYLRLLIAPAIKQLDAIRAERKKAGRWNQREKDFYRQAVENLHVQALREVIFLEILRKEADRFIKMGFKVPQREVDRYFRMQLERAGGPAGLALMHGLSVAALKDMARDQVLGQAYRENIRMNVAKPTPKEVADYYKFHSELLRRPESVRARAIFIKRFVYDEKTGEKVERKSARKRAEMILAKLKAGEDFAKIARRYSEDSKSAAQDGMLGEEKKRQLVTRRQFEPGLDGALFSGKAGELSGIVQGPANLYIVKVIRHLPAGVPPLDEIEDEVYKRCFVERIKKLENKVFAECYHKVLVRDARGRPVPIKALQPRKVRVPKESLFSEGGA